MTRLCVSPGCPALVERGRCATHARAAVLDGGTGELRVLLEGVSDAVSGTRVARQVLDDPSATRALLDLL